MPRKPLDNRRAERAFAIPALAQQTGTVAHNCRAACTKSSEYTRQNLEHFAEFMARMIEKYGHKVLAEMEREEAEKQQNGQ